jgi:hypothetical protein
MTKVEAQNRQQQCTSDAEPQSGTNVKRETHPFTRAAMNTKKSAPKSKPATRKAPWRKANPKAKSGKSHKLTTAQKSAAKARAAKAGRPYPNLVDNMAVARKKPAKNKSSTAKAKR